MATLLLYETPFCHAAEVAERWAGETGARLVDTDALVALTSRSMEISPPKLLRAIAGSISVFNPFTHEHEKAVAALRAAVAAVLEEDGVVLVGPATLLVPRSVAFALRVCLVAPQSYRVEQAQKALGVTAKEAARQVASAEAAARAWGGFLFEPPPWDASLHDVVLPMHTTPLDEAMAVIRENIDKPSVRRTADSAATIADLQLAARINVALAGRGHDVEVACENGYATVVINRFTLRLERVEEELKRLTLAVPGVRGATTRVGPRFRQPGLYVELDADTPSKVLLVDDEREFVQTLSERLLSRNVGAAVAYSGEEALAIIESDEPEVVVLDLQMPGIDGIEVLRRVRKGHPDTQVIILTGHGTDRERRLAAELGAFAYLQKPVDISVLSRTMKEAYRAIGRRREDGDGAS